MHIPQPYSPAKPRVHRKRHASAATPPAPVALTLVSANFDGGAETLTLEFDRAINVAGIHPAQITVKDGSDTGTAFAGFSVFDLTGSTLVLNMAQTGEAGIPDTRLWATGTNGIVASDDGGTWAGVTDLELPFGS